MNPTSPTHVHPVHRHYRKVLGVAREVVGWDIGELKLDVAIFNDLPSEGATTFATGSLSSFTGQELLLSCYTRQASSTTPRLLAAIADPLFQARQGVERGQVLGPAGPIEEGALAEALYVCPPVYFPPELDPLVSDDLHVHFFWLVPVHAVEARWIRAHQDGGYPFEDLLQDQDPDLLDLRRPPLLLP